MRHHTARHFLLLRMQQLAGILGLVLALLLGAPLSLTLPILDGRLVSDVPTIATGAVAWIAVSRSQRNPISSARGGSVRRR